MQQDLEVENTTGVPIKILGINSPYGTANFGLMAAEADLPLMQDLIPDPHVGALWGATNRDVVVLDGCNAVVTVHNLSSHNLEDPTHYNYLKQLLLYVATDWSE